MQTVLTLMLMKSHLEITRCILALVTVTSCKLTRRSDFRRNVWVQASRYYGTTGANPNFTGGVGYVAPQIDAKGELISNGSEPVFPGWDIVLIDKEYNTANPQVWLPGTTIIEIDGKNYLSPEDRTQPVEKSLRLNAPILPDHTYSWNSAKESFMVYARPLDGVRTVTGSNDNAATAYAQLDDNNAKSSGGLAFNFFSYGGLSGSELIRYAYLTSDPVAIVEGSTLSFQLLLRRNPR